MMRLVALARSKWRQLRASSLLMNAVYLMLATLVMAALGFVFWVVVSRAYDPAAVGLATTLLAVSGLLSLAGLAGFDTAFVRFLPRAQQKNEYITGGLCVVAAITAVLAAAVAVILPIVSSDFAVLRSGGAFAAFVFFTVVTGLNTLTNAVFLAGKRAGYILLINTLFSLCKVLLPLALVRGGALMIFLIAGVAQLVGLGLSLWWMYRAFGYRFVRRFDTRLIRANRRFSTSAYAASMLNLLPPTVLPLLIIAQLGAAEAAYYYMAFTIAGVLYTIIYASMQSVFAESSHDEAATGRHVRGALRLLCWLLPAAVLGLVLLSPWLLGLFGASYSQGASGLLRLFALGALPVALYAVLGAIFKVTKNVPGMLGMNVIYAGTIMAVSYLALDGHGLAAVGWAWLAGNVAAGVSGLGFLYVGSPAFGRPREQGMEHT